MKKLKKLKKLLVMLGLTMGIGATAISTAVNTGEKETGWRESLKCESVKNPELQEKNQIDTLMKSIKDDKGEHLIRDIKKIIGSYYIKTTGKKEEYTDIEIINILNVPIKDENDDGILTPDEFGKPTSKRYIVIDGEYYALDNSCEIGQIFSRPIELIDKILMVDDEREKRIDVENLVRWTKDFNKNNEMMNIEITPDGNLKYVKQCIKDELEMR